MASKVRLHYCIAMNTEYPIIHDKQISVHIFKVTFTRLPHTEESDLYCTTKIWITYSGGAFTHCLLGIFHLKEMAIGRENGHSTIVSSRHDSNDLIVPQTLLKAQNVATVMQEDSLGFSVQC